MPMRVVNWKGYDHDGAKRRCFAPLINVSLEELVPQDHFYRHLDRTLDLSFIVNPKQTFRTLAILLKLS